MSTPPPAADSAPSLLPATRTTPSRHPLAAEVAGPVLVPGEPGYDQEVVGFNLAHPHSPDVVVGATSAADVATTVRFAHRHGMPVGVQATGHGVATLVDHGVLITTSRMQDLTVDPVDRTATVGAGVRWRALLDVAATHGLTGACGSTSDVGVVGYTIGGGLPVLGRSLGFACDRVRGMDVVTADGVLHHVDAEHDVDLFWALRGGTSNVGIVTSMTIELLPITDVYGGGLIFEGERAEPVLRAFRDVAATAPEHCCLSIAFLRLPPMPEVPEPLRGRFVVHVRVSHLGDPLEAERLIAPLRAAAPVMMDMVGPLPVTELDRIHMDPEHPAPAHERGMLLADLDDAAIEALLEVAGPESDTPVLMVEVRQLGGALDRPGPVPDAVGARGAPFSLFVVGVLAPPVADVMGPAVDAVVGALAPYGTGKAFVNFHGLLHDEDDRKRCWSDETYRRLQQAKAVHDPQNTFRFGHAVAMAT